MTVYRYSAGLPPETVDASGFAKGMIVSVLIGFGAAIFLLSLLVDGFDSSDLWAAAIGVILAVISILVEDAGVER